jgi:hypothetical protein
MDPITLTGFFKSGFVASVSRKASGDGSNVLVQICSLCEDLQQLSAMNLITYFPKSGSLSSCVRSVPRVSEASHVAMLLSLFYTKYCSDLWDVAQSAILVCVADCDKRVP